MNATSQLNRMTKTAPLCPLCKVNALDWQYEPGSEGGYNSICDRCFWLSGYDPQSQGNHVHDHTASSLRPAFEDGTLTGWTCTGSYDGKTCDYFQPLVARYVARSRPWFDRVVWQVFDFQNAKAESDPAWTEEFARTRAIDLNAA